MTPSHLIWPELFEKFIASECPNENRFGLEGRDFLIWNEGPDHDRPEDPDAKHATVGTPRVFCVDGAKPGNLGNQVSREVAEMYGCATW
jgi:hypothetical protein